MQNMLDRTMNSRYPFSSGKKRGFAEDISITERVKTNTPAC